MEEKGLEQDWEVKDFTKEGRWDINALKMVVSEDMAEHISDNFQSDLHDRLTDKPWWIASNSGMFTTKSAYHNLKKKKR